MKKSLYTKVYGWVLLDDIDSTDYPKFTSDSKIVKQWQAEGCRVLPLFEEATTQPEDCCNG